LQRVQGAETLKKASTRKLFSWSRELRVSGGKFAMCIVKKRVRSAGESRQRNPDLILQNGNILEDYLS
jgi:hypothetical protein